MNPTPNSTPSVESIVEEFYKFKQQEYGKWKVGREEAMVWLRTQLTALEKRVREEPSGYKK